jgi:integrase
MSLYKRAKWYWMHHFVNGVEYRLSLKTKNWQEAKRLEKEKLAEIAEGKFGSQGKIARKTFSAAADTYIQERQLHSAEKTRHTDQERSIPLRRYFTETPLRRITAEMIVDYQVQRKAAGVSGRTINLEVGLLRRILKKHKQWWRLAEEVRMLPETPKPARVLSAEEKAKLLQLSATKPAWQVARCAAVLALNTTMRGCELNGLRWKNTDLFEKVLRIERGSTKTDAGERVIPLNHDAVLALAELKDRAEKLGSANPDHYVLPACENGIIDATKPMKSCRSAWRNLTKAAGLKGLRFHDLRHQAITELLESGLSDQAVKSIAGHVSQKMLDHYSHIRLQAKRQAVECLRTSAIQSTQMTDSTVEPKPNPKSN